MGDITVRVQGISSGNEGNRGFSSENRGKDSISPIGDNRIVEDLRRAVITHGAVYIPSNNSFNPIIRQAERQERGTINKELTDKYSQKREDLDKRWEETIDSNNLKLQNQRKKELEGVTDPRVIEHINRKWDKIEDIEQPKLNKKFQGELNQINKEEKDERLQREGELTKAIEKLTDSIKRTGTLNPDSYLGQLRKQKQEAIFKRDNAEDKKTSEEAAKKVREVDKKIKDVTEGKEIDYSSRALQTLLGADQIVNGISNRNIGSVIMGTGQMVTNALGMDDKTAAKSLAWLTPLATVGTLLTQEGLKSDQMAGLAALIRGNGSIADSRASMYSNLWRYGYKGANIFDMGLSVPEFAQSAEKRISQRGVSQNGVSEAFFQEALERVFSLNRGSLGAAGKYDRYGWNATDAIVNLVSNLEQIGNSGVSQGNYARVQEYLNMQQDLMSNYMRFSNKPSAANVNRDIEAFANLDNYVVDSRTSSEIKSVQNQLLKPQNDRIKAILYGTVEETIPTYNGQNVRGRVDLIDRILHDPKYQGVVERALMQKLTAMYGGTDTTLGYLMAKSQLSGIESPERRDAIWNGITKGTAGDILSSYKQMTGETEFDKKTEYSKQIRDYVSSATQTLVELSDAIFNGSSWIERIGRKVTKVAGGQSTIEDIVK